MNAAATDWDIVIVGGGLGGLSLAVELAHPEFSHLRVLVLEKRHYYTRDRTWSYWATHPHRYSALERKRWNAWRVSFQGQQATQHSALAYCTMDADAFYQSAQARIAVVPHVELRLGRGVDSIDEQGPQPGQPSRVRLSDGTALSAAWVVDARPPGPPQADSLCQHFVGWEIETSTDCFDEGVVDLMDFQCSAQGLHFFYVLPYGPRRALVESTWISPFAHRGDYAAELQHYLATRYPTATYVRTYEERGCLDLQAPLLTAARTQLLAAGRRAGTLRSSTGFAFLETVDDARRMAQCFAATPLNAVRAAPYRRNPLDAWMDKVFCEAVMANWQRAPEFFMAMFKGVSAQTLVAFLSGRPRLMQRLQVTLQLPKLPFLRAAWRVVAG